MPSLDSRGETRAFLFPRDSVHAMSLFSRRRSLGTRTKGRAEKSKSRPRSRSSGQAIGRQRDALLGRFGRFAGPLQARNDLAVRPALPEELPTTEFFAVTYEMKKTILFPTRDRPRAS